jgi:hypothetical protein
MVLEPILRTVVSYNASVEKLHNATSSLARFEVKTFSTTSKNEIAYTNAGVVVVGT